MVQGPRPGVGVWGQQTRPLVPTVMATAAHVTATARAAAREATLHALP